MLNYYLSSAFWIILSFSSKPYIYPAKKALSIFSNQTIEQDYRQQEKNTEITQENLLAFDYEDFDFWADQCLLLSQEDDYEKTIEVCEKAISLKEKRDNVDLWISRSDALFHKGDYREAIASFNRVLRVLPNHSMAMTYKCASLFQLNVYEDAIDSCENALEANANWAKESPAKAWYYRGLALQSIGRSETALNSFLRAIIIDPENILAKAGLCSLETDLRIYYSPSLRNNIIQILGVENFENLFREFQSSQKNRSNQVICSLDLATEIYEKAIAQNPNNATLWMEQGSILEQLGRFEQALTSYEQATIKLPNYSIALAHQCAMLIQVKQYEKALESCDAAIQGNNNWGKWRDDIGSAYGWTQTSAAFIGLGQYEDALAAAERAIAIVPEYPAAWNNKAVSHWYLNELNQGKNSIDRALQEHQKAQINYQDQPNIPNEIFQLNQYESPIFFYRSQIIALHNQGRIAMSQGELIAAINAYSKALQTYDIQREEWGFPIVNDPFLANIHTNLLTAYISKNISKQCGSIIDIGKMLSSAKIIKDIYPDRPTSWYSLGLVQLYSCNYQAAQNAFTEAIRLNPEDIYSLTGLGIVIARMPNQNINKAIELFEHASNIDPMYSLPKACREILLARSGLPVETESTNTDSNGNQCDFWL